MVPGQSSLEIYSIGRLNGTVRGKLNGGSLDKRSGSHNDLAVISRHIPWLRRYIAVHGRGCLDPLAEGNDTFRCAKGNGLDNVMAGLIAVRNHLKSQAFIDIGGKYSAL